MKRSNPFELPTQQAGELVPPEPPYVTGGPPFPEHASDEGRYGISILDYFASAVITGLVSRANYTIDDLKTNGARDAYWIAATMVQFRDQIPIDPTPVPVAPEEPKPPKPPGPPPHPPHP